MKIILGPFLLLLFRNGGVCEAGTITVPIIAHSKNVSSEDIIVNNNTDDDFDQEDVMISAKNLGSSQDPVVVDDDTRKGDVEKKSEPCPLSLSRGDEESEDSIHNHGNESKLPYPAFITATGEERQETALEKITESISGVFSTIKSSVASIFSPGYGLPDQSEDATNCTTSSSSKEEGITNATNISSNNSTFNNATEGEPEHHHEDEDQKLELEDEKKKNEQSTPLIHSDVSSDDTNNSSSTNATQVTSTTSTTTTLSTNID